MYKITYIHKDGENELPLYTPGNGEYGLTKGILKLEVGKSGELNISVPDTNPAKADIVCPTDEVIVYRDNNELWRGRPVTRESDFIRTGSLSCEGVLSYLYDTFYPPYDFQGSHVDLIKSILDNHNAQVGSQKQIKLGTVTVTDPNDYIARSDSNYARSLSVLSEKLVGESLGGYLRIRIADGIKYLDYLDGYGTTAEQVVQYGVNLIDLAETVEYGDAISAVLPLGAEDEETGERLTVASVNGGELYVSDKDLVEEYGWIAEVVEWDDVTIASNLLTKAQTYLQQAAVPVRTLSINAVDLSLVSKSDTAINLGDMVRIQSDPHGINQYMELTSMEINILDPSADTLSFGAETAGFTERSSSSSRQISESLNSVTTIVKNLSANTVTTDYLSANYATIANLNAANAEIEDLKVADVNITEKLNAADAYIENLTADNVVINNQLSAVSADVSTLTATTAEITSLLAGNAGVGNLQAIHLTSANTIIDNAVITDAMIADLSASKLTAGDIFTTKVRIYGDESKLLSIVDNTIQISDGTVVRVQIGEDASGDYNMYLWDALGNRLWNATGVTESGLNDGIIKDVAVADDAAIKGTKLDIESVAECLNNDGSLIVDASQVTIDDTTLSAAYTTIIQTSDTMQKAIQSLESEKTVVRVETYYCLSKADVPLLDENGNVLLDENGDPIYDFVMDEQWTTKPLTASDEQHLWVRYLVTYNDGTQEWTEPVCLTDTALREKTSTLITEFEVVQGQISSKVWMSDIETATDSMQGQITTLTDKYTSVTQTVDSINAQVAELKTSSDEYSSKITTLEQTVDAFKVSVSETYATISSVSGIETRLATAESNITANAQEIALSVKETDMTGDYLIGKINLSSTTATIAASHINLSGAVTVSALADDVTAQINTATSNASTAITNAATANTNASTALGYARYHYGTCSTAASTAAKVVSLSGFVLYTGATVSVKFTYANSVASPTLNVNSTGAKSIYIYGSTLTASSVHNWVAGSTVTFVYNGTQWVMTDTSANKAIANWCYDNNLTYIDGGAIYAKSVTATQIDVDDLFAQDITATNLYITGNSVFDGTLNAATGSFAGTVYATNVKFDGFETHLKSDNNLVMASGGRGSADGEILIDSFQYHHSNYTTSICILGPTINVADDINFVAIHNGDSETTGTAAVGFGVGTGGYNRGVYDFETESWMLYADRNNKIYLNGIKLSEADSSGVFHRYGKVVEVRYYGTTVANKGSCPSGYRPSSTVSISGWLIYSDLAFPAYIMIDSSGTVNVKYVSIATGTGEPSSPVTAAVMYFNGCYIIP